MEQPPYILGDLHAVHGELLVGALGLHLEAFGAAQLAVQVRLGAVQDGVLVLLAGPGPGDGDDAEDLLAGGVGLVHVAAVGLGLHIDGALPGVYLKFAAVLEAAADIAHELVLEGVAVEALEDHLPQLEENDVVHMESVPFPLFSGNIIPYCRPVVQRAARTLFPVPRRNPCRKGENVLFLSPKSQKNRGYDP